MDITYKLLQGDWHSAVYNNGKLIGQVFRMKPNTWAAVPECTPTRQRSITANGFKTKRYAVDFLVQWQEEND